MVTIGRITDEGVENLGSRLGSYYKGGPTLVEITEDSIYNYAVDNGDANPLYVDPDHAARSRFGGLIAPPAIVDVIKHYTAGMVGGLPGVHQFHSGNDVTFYRAHTNRRQDRHRLPPLQDEREGGALRGPHDLYRRDHLVLQPAWGDRCQSARALLPRGAPAGP